jgi:hypothetical protein
VVEVVLGQVVVVELVVTENFQVYQFVEQQYIQ